MNKKIILHAVVLLLAPLTSVRAADLAGNWILRVPCNQTVCETVFSFKVEGKTLTGKVSTEEDDDLISEGKIENDRFSFVVTQNVDDKEVTFRYTGKFGGMVYGDEIELIRQELGGTGDTQKFTAKKEFPLGDYQWPPSYYKGLPR